MGETGLVSKSKSEQRFNTELHLNLLFESVFQTHEERGPSPDPVVLGHSSGLQFHTEHKRWSACSPRTHREVVAWTQVHAYTHTHTHRVNIAGRDITQEMERPRQKLRHDSLLDVFLRFSTGLRWMLGTGQTICMGSASTRQEFFLSQPAPSRYRPRTNTPSWEGRRKK